MKANTNDFIPSYLKSRRCWVLWRKEWKTKKDGTGGRWTKVPYQINGRYHASSTNPDTWSEYLDTVQAFHNLGGFSGLGVMLSKQLRVVFIDIDHCMNEDGMLSDVAEDILKAFDGRTYTEISQSGSGLHILALGTIPRASKNTIVEMYQENRYCAFTGNAVIAEEPANCQDAINYVFDKYKTQAAPKLEFSRNPTPVSFQSDKQIIEKASQHGRFNLLYSGNYEKAGYGSQSEADQALCVILAFWSDRNPDTIDRIFRTSGLYRDKWEREDYRQTTIAKACARIDMSFTEWRRKQNNDLKDSIFQYW